MINRVFMLAMPPWHELDTESVCMELRKPSGGLSLEGLSHPFDTILRAGLVVEPDSRHLTLDQLHNTLGIALVVASTQVVQIKYTSLLDSLTVDLHCVSKKRPTLFL